MTPRRTGDDTLEMTAPSSAHAQHWAGQLRGLPGVEEAVPGMASLSVRFAPKDLTTVLEHLSGIDRYAALPSRVVEPLSLEIHYGGSATDLSAICHQLGVTEQSFIVQHCAATYTVELLGFVPGFAYLSGLPKALDVPRLAAPRPRVPAGSIGISVGYTGTYALPGPGGWPLIGTTRERLFDPGSAQPFRLAPGQRVRFTPI